MTAALIIATVCVLIAVAANVLLLIDVITAHRYERKCRR